ncbi:polysaccharide deacetylase family protein [Sphingomonas panni]
MIRRLMVAMLTLLVASAPAAAQKRIALTFDDAPRARGPFLTPDERTERIIAGLRKAKVRQAAFFVVPGNLSAPDGAGASGGSPPMSRRAMSSPTTASAIPR